MHVCVCVCVCLFCGSEHKQVYMTNMPLVIAYSFKGTVLHQTVNTLLKGMTLDLMKAVKFNYQYFALLSPAAGSLHNSTCVTKVLHYSTEVMKERTSVTECLSAQGDTVAVACELQQGAEFLHQSRLQSSVYVVKSGKKEKNPDTEY